MPIGGLINGMFEGIDAARERAYTNEMRKAAVASLPDATAEMNSRARLNTAINQSGLNLVAPREQNALKQLQNEGAGLDAAAARQTDELATQANTALINKVLSDHAVEDVPNVVAEHRNKRLFSNVDAQMAGIAKLSDLLRMGDKGKVIKFMNDMRKANPEIGLDGDVHNVTVTDDPQSGDYLFSALDKQGNPLLQMTASQMQSINDMVRPRTKDDFKVMKPGQTLVKTRNGIASPVYTAPESQQQKNAKKTSLEQNLNMLTTRFGMNERDALAYLNTSKTVSREQFILKGMQDLIAIGKQPSDEDVANFGRLYDSTRSQPAEASNSPETTKLDPKIKSLLGLPP
ncbi:MAG: hypothetical protein HRU77_01440 [Gammaproteobacteria bacterium]|nr:MAG: hypothetical protein HRU77_01440 [Gammaproteobacteria bacterium]